MRIACPKCEWEPCPADRWQCTCGHAWHTFDTHGRCPACGRVWRQTQCLACHRWSPHHDWYRDLPPVDALDLEREHVEPEGTLLFVLRALQTKGFPAVLPGTPKHKAARTTH